MFRFSLVASVAVVALALSGCAAATEPPVLSEEEAALLMTGDRDLAPYLEQDFSWGSCPTEWLVDSPSFVLAQSEVECGTVLVPATYEGSQDIPDFSIAVMRVTRVGDQPKPTTGIFINPGGPGGSGLEQVQTSNFPEELHTALPFIGFDPRGVGFSDFADGTEIACSDELDYISYFGEASPSSEAELDARVVDSDKYYQDCVDSNPYWWTLSTDNVARDLELMRQVITPGEALNFLGSSYGTTIAGRYVSLFPEGVGHIVFDSPTTVDDDRIASALENIEADEAKLRGFVEGYASYDEISFDDAWERIMKIRQNADDDQLIGYAGFEESEASPGYMISGEALFIWGLRTLNYYPADFAQEVFNRGIDEAYFSKWNGTFEWLAFSLDGYDPDSLDGASLADKNIIRTNSYEVRVIVNTMDYSGEPLSDDEQREISAKSAEIAPLMTALNSDSTGYEYIGPPKGLSWEDFATEDPLIPDPPKTPFIPSNPSGKQLLIIGSIDESVTPYSFAQDTAKLLAAPLVSVESSEHAPAAGYDNECINEVLTSYFLGTADVVDVTCPG